MVQGDSRDQMEDDHQRRKSMDASSPPVIDEDRNTAEETDQNSGGGTSSDGTTTNEYKEKTSEEVVNAAAGGTTTSSSSVLHNLTVFRDFFLAAFSDGYNVSSTVLHTVYNANLARKAFSFLHGLITSAMIASHTISFPLRVQSTFCGVDDVATCCKGSKVAPLNDGGGIKSSRSVGASFDSPSIQQSTSHDHSRRRRRKPVAVAVGFNYTKDANGRPIVITPTGSRNSPIDLTKSTSVGGGGSLRNSPPRTNKGPAPSLPILTQGTTSTPSSGTLPAIRPSQTRYRPGDNSMAC
jgi:hypothetical protein